MIAAPSPDAQSSAIPEWVAAPRTGNDLEHLKGQFLATVNHELRTPLSGVLGMVDLLAETELSAEQKDYLGSVRDCALELLGALNSILEYSSWSAGNFRLEQSEFALRPMLEGLSRETKLILRDKPISFGVVIDPALPETVIGDELHLHHAIGYLLANSVKFTKQGSIRLEVRLEDVDRHGANASGATWIRFAVVDTGIGIPPRQLGLIFESFRQLDSGLARLYRGLGLGLTLAKAMVEAMGGNISVQSREGSGSTFTLLIPFSSLRSETRRSPAARTSPARILLVDDNRIAQAVVAHALKKGSYLAEFADDGEQGLEMARNAVYDLILMDLQMPGMDGFETARKIRELERYANVPIVALTANYSDEQRTAAQTFGMQGYIGKPVKREELLAAIDKHLSASR